jgi:hypothetical protein
VTWPNVQRMSGLRARSPIGRSDIALRLALLRVPKNAGSAGPSVSLSSITETATNRTEHGETCAGFANPATRGSENGMRERDAA